MDKKLTILDVKKKKIELETSILKLVNDFEEECGVYCSSYINMDRGRDDSTEVCCEKPAGPEKKGPIKNVDIRMDLDLIY
jgi:hypothetical protein